MKVLDIAVVIVVVLVALGLALLVGVVKQYQVGVMLFRLGLVLGRRPGLHRIVSGMCRRWRISRPSPSVLTSGAANG